MFDKGMSIRALAALVSALLVAAGARAGDELTPERREQLETEARKLNDQGLAQYRQGKPKEATALLEKALALRRRLYHTDHPDLAVSLNNLGSVLEARGDYDRAEPLLREALALRRRLFPKDHPDLAQSLTNLGGVLRRRGDLAGAEQHCREALALRRRLYSGDHPDLARSLNNLGSLLEARGDLGGAEPLLRESLAMRRRLFPQGHPDLATSLNNLGLLLKGRGDLGEAERHYRDALAMLRRLYPKDHPNLASSLNNLGFLLQTRGDLAGAERHLTEAIAMLRRLHPEGHPDLARSLNNLGLVLQSRGDLVGAERHYRDALALRQRFYPTDHPGVANTLNNLGMVLRARGDLVGAEPLVRDALAMYRRLYPKDHPDLARSLNNLGLVLQDRGDLVGAEPLVRDALAMFRRLYPQDHPRLAGSLSNLGVLLRARGDDAGARRCCAEALAMQQRFLFKEIGLLPEADALNLAASLPHTRDGFLSFTRGEADAAPTYDLVWQGRSAVTRLAEQRHRDLLAHNSPEFRKLGEELLRARRHLAHLLLAPVRDAAKHAQEVRALTEAKENLEKELARKLNLELLAAHAAPPPPRRLAAALPVDAVFLDFYRYTHYEYDAAAAAAKRWRRTPHYVVFVLGEGRPAVRVELGETAPLEQAWSQWHTAITRNAPVEHERKAAARLGKLVWHPLREKLPAGVRTLYLALDGALTQAPFAALPGAKPGTVLLEEYAFATVPHGPFLLDRLDQRGRDRLPGSALLVVGDVDYHQPAKTTDRRGAWARLPATRAEMERVADLAEKHARLKARRLTGAGATTAAVLDELPQARYAHLATHGFFADDHFRSAFQVDPEAFHRLTPDRRGGARSPLVLSGLVFAGANRQGADAPEDRGILTAEALVGLRLDKLDLAVLSACNTGLGEVGGGEGVYGLQRAFHIAGCKGVIASLWAVEDESTAALMTLFYTHLWRDKLPPLEALRQAQLHLYRHPQQMKQLARRDFDEVPLPREGAAPPGPRARTAQWAAFTFSGVAAPARAGD
jgi:CHAT domain-containing protein/Flp pilus assembly protein TadD